MAKPKRLSAMLVVGSDGRLKVGLQVENLPHIRFATDDARDRLPIKEVYTTPMKNPPHPGGFVLRQCIEPFGLTITDAAALGVTRTTVSELVNEKRGISPEMAVRLSKVFGGSAAGWLMQQAHYDLARVYTNGIKLRRLVPP